jgi:penicillin-binding protein 2
VSIGLVFIGKLFYLQLLDDTYEKAADNNAIRKIIQVPFRGEVYDRKGKLIVYNTPVYDVYITPRKAVVQDTNRFCKLFGVTRGYFDTVTKQARAYSRVKPSLFLKHLTKEDFARIQQQLLEPISPSRFRMPWDMLRRSIRIHSKISGMIITDKGIM